MSFDLPFDGFYGTKGTSNTLPKFADISTMNSMHLRSKDGSIQSLNSPVGAIMEPSPLSGGHRPSIQGKGVTEGRRQSSVAYRPPPKKSNSTKANEAVKILNRYSIAYKNDWDIPQSLVKAREQIENHIVSGEPIELVMPAFPFKSSNRTKKVLGALPDEAERISLLHLNGLCDAIKDATDHDSHFVIVSDGICYNDLLGVSDSEVWNYGTALRKMAEDLKCHNLRFARIYELLGPEYAPNGELTEEEYLIKVPEYREALEKKVPDGFSVEEQIINDPDTKKTYSGYKKFLSMERDVKVTNSSAEKQNAVIAKCMMHRGKAFATSISEAFPQSIRLSIHPSTDTNKTSIKLLPQDNDVVMTPWHGALVRGADGSSRMMHASDVPSVTHDIVNENGYPRYFRERSPLFEWLSQDVHFEFLYPTGIIIRPRNPEAQYPLCSVDMQKVRTLAERCSPIILRNFTETKSERAFTAKAHDLGEVLPWKSGVIQKVRDEGNLDPTSNSVVSNEAMPMHYDGMFKLITVTDESTGKEKQVSDTPRFQYFVSQAVAPPGDGYTLFSSSANFVRYLPQAYNLTKLSKIRWTCNSHGFFNHTMEGLPLIVPHPTMGTPCVRWHQPWPRWRTAFGYADIRIDNGSQNLIPLIDSLLFDRRVCLYFSWEEGDVLVSDNFAMLHTRTAFKGNSPRELWRIHTN